MANANYIVIKGDYPQKSIKKLIISKERKQSDEQKSENCDVYVR